MYNYMDAGQVPKFELHDVTARLAMMYERTLKYSELQLSAEHDRLRATNSRNPRTMAEQALAYEAALDGFAIQRWPDHNLANIKFPSVWRKRLAKVAIQIITVEQLRKELLPSCQLRFSSLYACAYELVEIITSTVLANSPNPPDSRGPTQNPPENVLRSTRPAAMPAKATPQAQPPYSPHNIPSTLENSSRPYVPYPTTPAVTSARAAPRDQPPYALRDVLPTPETCFSPNMLYPITPVVTSAKAAPRDQSPYASRNVPPTLETSSAPNTPYPITPAVTPARAAP